MSSSSVANFIFTTVFLSPAATIEDKLNFRLNWSKNPQDPHEVQRIYFTIALFLAQAVPFFSLNFLFQILVDFVPMTKLAPYRFNGAQMPPVDLIVQAMLLTTLYSLFGAVFVYLFGFDLIVRKNPSLMSDSMMSHHDSSFSYSSTTTTPSSMPSSIWVFLFQLVFCYVVTDFLFYWFHRALHEIPLAYEFIHKHHHKFIISCGWAAMYAHPLEFIFGNIIPVIAACYLFNFHAVVWFTWVALAITGTTLAHSGFKHYDVFEGGVKGSQIHDFHHTHQISNYGHTLLWDRICGTDRVWKKYWGEKQQQKNRNDDVGVDATMNKKKNSNRRNKNDSLMTTVGGAHDDDYNDFMKREVLKKASEIVNRGKTRAGSWSRTRTASKKKNTKERTSSSTRSTSKRKK